MKTRLLPLVVILLTILLYSSCKKQQVVVNQKMPLTLSELKLAALKDTSIINATKSIKVLIMLKQAQINSLLKDPSKNTLSINSKTSTMDISNIQISTDVLLYFRSNGYANSDVIANELLAARNSFKEFFNKYPEATKLSRVDFIDLFHASFANILKTSYDIRTMDNFKVLGDTECAYSFMTS